MHNIRQKYCLDTNFFIEAWNKYYSPEFCESYWDVIDNLAKEGIVFITQEVKKEIDKGDDNLKEWLKNKNYIVRPIDQKVQLCLRELYMKDKSHQYLANSLNTQKIKIPDVCQNMNVKWINDFEFIKEVNIKFICETE